MNKTYELVLKKNDKPTLKERIFGIPSSDEISKIKYKINLINIFVVIGIMILASSYFIENSFKNRSVTITTEYEKLIKLPEIKIESHSIYMKQNPIYMNYVEIIDENNKDLFLSKLENIIDPTKDNFVNYINLTENYVNLTMTSVTLFPNDYFSLGANQHLRLYIGYFRENLINQYYSFNITITVNNNETFLISSKESFNMAISKTIKIDQYKNQVEIYKTRLTTIIYGPDVEEDYIGDTMNSQISFYTQIVTTETTQTDFEIYLEILSSIGSLISTVVLVCCIAFSIITKFFIKDKGGWIDNEIREAIVYHSNLLNNDNLLDQSLSPLTDSEDNTEEEIQYINQ